jgi:hypothetical protein
MIDLDRETLVKMIDRTELAAGVAIIKELASEKQIQSAKQR